MEAAKKIEGFVPLHTLKILPGHFRDVRSGKKKAEFRRNDRVPKFREGDVLHLREWDGDYTGREIYTTISHLCDVSDYVGGNFVMLSLSGVIV